MTPSLATPRPKESDWRLFLRLVPYARKSGRLLAISLVLLVPLAFAGAIQPILVGEAVSLIRRESTVSWLMDRPLQQGLNLLSLLLAATIGVRLAFRGVQGYLVQEVGQQITAAIRNDLFDHVTALAVRFYDRTPVGKLITRLTSDVEALGDVFSTGAIGIVSDILSLLIVTVAMFSLQWKLASLLVLILVPVTGLILYLQHQYRKANYKAREELSQLNSALQENILGIGVVQIFRRERFNSEQFRRTNYRYMGAVDKTIFHDSAISATLEWISLVAIAGVLWLGGWLVEGQSLNLGTLTSFILFSQRVFDPLRQLAEKFTAIQSGLTAVERIADLLNEPIEIQDPHQHQAQTLAAPTLTLGSPHTPSGEICFKQVSLAYKPGEYVLHDLNFTIHPGEKVALVGPTGAGKSSIIRLLCRLYEATEGQILIDGLNVRDLAQGDLRRYLGVILQDGFLFAGDVKGNIALGESYSLDQIRAAAASMNVDQFIDQLPQAYDTELRQRGTNLSVGEKQLLAFARVAVRDPKILVLDEATANLDVGTESLVQKALDRLLVNRTAIIIAHRLSTIRNVDRILVLKQGRLVESGSHSQLLAQGGLYASLYQLQMLGQ
ncbi:ABC transporter ATP-binding protein [Prochlorothrix hollandica]|uniref:ABC transporter ATP-binding protein n=1 Tax=Prochlorothrix hollandica TaxID=1223 RepID=UPI00038045DE|nr:ABC transporter ATP-binding protein [Prochlorothrix hollandica]